jgi:quinolinate synthase
MTRFPEAEVIAHPECESSVLGLAKFIGSTRALLDYSVRSAAKSFIVATEPGIIHQMEKHTSGSGKSFIAAPPNSACACNECPHMKLNTLEKLYLAMRLGAPEVNVRPDLAEQALVPIRRMLEWS